MSTMQNRNNLIKEFSSLAPISEVYSTESMHLPNKIEYNGLLKRDAGLLTMWQNRTFTLRIGQSEKAELIISKHEAVAEEKLYLSKLKLTKKCTLIDATPCFGVVMENGKKYLLSLKNIHQCQRFHAEMSHIKKMEKELVFLFKSRRQTSVINKQNQQLSSKKIIGKKSNQIIETNQESDELSESEEAELIKRRYQKKSRSLSSHSSKEDNIFQTNLCQVPTSVIAEIGENMDLEIENFFDRNQNTLLSSNKGLIPYPCPGKQKILINNDNVVKCTIVLSTPASANACMQRFLQFSSWNQQVKKTKSLSQHENGQIIYIQFTKTISASQSRCAVVEVSLLKGEYCSAFRLRSVRRANYEYLTEKKQVRMELYLKVVTDRSNKLQKVLTAALTIKPSKEQLQLAVKFLRELNQFQQTCKTLI